MRFKNPGLRVSELAFRRDFHEPGLEAQPPAGQRLFGLNHVLTADPKCLMLGFTKGRNIAEHGCQAVPGDSGSPIIIPDGKKYRIVAVHSAHTKNRIGGKGFAVPSNAFMKALAKLDKRING